MALDDIKVGETLYVRAKVCTINENNTCWVRIEDAVYGTQYHDVVIEPKNLYPFLTYISKPIEIFKMTEIPATYPKYDPCRPFKKGDIVEPVACNGRAPLYLRKYIGTKQVVECDEDINGIVGIVGDIEAVSAAFLKLITPVEELEPYFIEESHDGATIVLTVRCIPNGEGIAFRYCPGWGGNVFHSEEQFRQHAVAERDRLNAEYRMEMEK